MKRMLFAAAALAAVCIGANVRDDRLPAKFVGDWCLAEHTADHLAFYRRGRCANPDNVDDWLTINGYCSEHLNIARHGWGGQGCPKLPVELGGGHSWLRHFRMASCNKLESSQSQVHAFGTINVSDKRDRILAALARKG